MSKPDLSRWEITVGALVTIGVLIIIKYVLGP